MATQYISFRGKAHYCKPYEAQIDRGFEDKDEGRFANWNTGLILDDQTLVAYNALNLSQVKVKEGNRVTFKRAEFKKDKDGNLEALGTPRVTLPDGADEGSAIGNGSDVSISIEVFDYTYKNRPGRAARWNAVTVHELVEYVKPEPQAAVGEAPAFGPNVPV